MKQQYKEWIESKLATADPFGMCREWTEEMQAAFPELQRVRGTVFISCLWEREHWWMVDPNPGEAGEEGVPFVIDPTKAQFSQEYFAGGAVVLWYQPRDESHPEPTGRCCNCGGYCYGGRTDLCSERCEQQYLSYLNSSLW